jgi:hypothetical protein
MVTYIFPPLCLTGVIYEPEGNDSLSNDDMQIDKRTPVAS